MSKTLGESVLEVQRHLRHGMEIRAEHHAFKTADDLEREFAFAAPHPEDSAEIKLIRGQLKAMFELEDDLNSRPAVLPEC